jgi:Mrp family chromosome partitioning ATPase
MGQILDEIGKHADLVIIDTPPSLVADAQILAARVDAVLFVVQPGSTRADMARAALDSFRRSGARVVGVVMNRIPKNRGYYYGGYKYYSQYGKNKQYYSESGTKSTSHGANSVNLMRPAQTVAEQPVRKPAQLLTSMTKDQSAEQPAGQVVSKLVEMPHGVAGSNGNSFVDEVDDDGEHPSVEKLFENVKVLPKRNAPKSGNNGWK